MSPKLDTLSPVTPGAPAVCPVDHGTARKKSMRPGVGSAEAPAIEQDAEGVWQVRGFAEVRLLLRHSDTRQAGFNADMVTGVTALTRHPVLYQEGKEHLEQRTKTARFFTPKTVSTNYRQLMEALSDQVVADVMQRRQVDLSQISMTLAVQVAGRVVGLTNSSTAGMTRRLDVFFSKSQNYEPPTLWNKWRQIFDTHRIVLFYFLDVRPAIAARRQQPQEDVISYLLGQDYTAQEILTECVTYAAAGMVTTREFICMAAWHLLEHPDLRDRYLAAGEEERLAILHETLRLEPVVAHLYRRATADITISSAGQAYTIAKGALIDLHVESANLDPAVVGAEPPSLCPGRPLTGERIGAMLMSFGDGAHRCPGAYLAMQETDIFLQRLLKLPGLRIADQPTLTWNELTAGYELRRFIVTLD